MQNYDVSVAGDVDAELEKELKLRLQEMTPAEDSTERIDDKSTEESTTHQTNPISLSNIGIVLVVGWLAFYSTYYSTYGFSQQWLSGILQGRGAEMLALSVMTLVFYINCRQRLRDKTNLFFGFSASSKSMTSRWLFIFFIWQFFLLLAKKYLLSAPNPQSFYGWPLTYFFVPVCMEIVFRGFILKALELHIKTVPALIVSSVLYCIASRTDFSNSHLAMAFGSGLLLGLARVKTGSIYPSLLMASVGRLVPAVLGHLVIGS